MTLRGKRRERRRRALLASAGALVLAVALGGLLQQADSRSRMQAALPTARDSSAQSAGASFSVFRLDGVGVFETREPTRVELVDAGSERQIHLREGSLRAEVTPQDLAKPLVVVTPQVRVVVVGTRFDVAVEADFTRVEVLQGRVRVESGAAALFVSGGGAIRSDDPGLRPPAASAPPELPQPARGRPGALSRPSRPSDPVRVAQTNQSAPVPARAATTVDGCAKLEAARARRQCLEAIASGAGLSAENALLSLGLHARDVEGDFDAALEHWRRYDERFPAGVLAPEVALSTFETLLLKKRVSAAVLAAVQFERRFPDDPRAAHVALARARLLCARASQRQEGLALLGRLAENADPAVRIAAIEARAGCQEPLEVWPGAAGLTGPPRPGRGGPGD